MTAPEDKLERLQYEHDLTSAYTPYIPNIILKFHPCPVGTFGHRIHEDMHPRRANILELVMYVTTSRLEHLFR